MDFGENNMKEYTVKTDKDLNKLISSVEWMMDRGWTCQGGISVNPEASDYPVYYQSMVK